MKKQITEKQHYVPQYYLKRFTNDNGFLYVYNKAKQKFHKSTPKDICFEKFLYETEWKNKNNIFKENFILLNSIEEVFSKKESEHNAFLERIIKILNDPLNERALIFQGKDKAILSDLITNLFTRHPYNFTRDYNFLLDDKLLHEYDLLQYKNMLEVLRFGDFESIATAAIKKAELTGIEGTGPTVDLVNLLVNLSCTIFQSENNNFITSSHPVTSGKKDGYTFVGLALNPRYYAIFTDDPTSKPFRNRLHKIDDLTVDKLNYNYMLNDYAEYVISPNEAYLKKLVNRR